MAKFIDLTGQIFGHLTVIKRVQNKWSQTAFLCKCSCGNEKIIRGSCLREGKATTCGCHHGLTPQQVITENIIVDDNGCWIWQKGKCSFGYGECYSGPKKQKRTHVHSYEVFKGEIPKGMYVCHKCDVPACCNPEHLFLGTQKDNVHDMFKKRRNKEYDKRGVNNPRAKLTEMDVIKIRFLIKDDAFGVCKIAKMYNVTKTTIMGIRDRRIWKHI